MFGWLKKKQPYVENENIRHIVSEDSFKKLVYEWNVRFPIDRFYRTKYSIKFGSPEHRDLSFLDMMFEFFEDRVYEELIDIKEDYTPNKGDYINENDQGNDLSKLSDDQMINVFKSVDLSKFDDVK